jgi:hypothetical protein
MSSKKLTPSPSPTTFLNSGSKKFTAQQASIYKIIFFNQQNELEYNNYLSSNTNIQVPVNQPNTFPKQNLTFSTYYHRPPFRAGGI